jgi:hypothetical protein
MSRHVCSGFATEHFVVKWNHLALQNAAKTELRAFPRFREKTETL